MTRTIIITFLVALLAGTALADTPTVSGVVRSDRGGRAANIAVKLYGQRVPHGEPLDTDETASNGVYNLTGGNVFGKVVYVHLGNDAVRVELRRGQRRFLKGRAKDLVYVAAGTQISTMEAFQARFAARIRAERVLVWAGAKEESAAYAVIQAWLKRAPKLYKGTKPSEFKRQQVLDGVLQTVNAAEDLPMRHVFRTAEFKAALFKTLADIPDSTKNAR